MSKVNSKITTNGQCIIDGQLFEQTANGNKLTCSPECKKKWDVQKRKEAKLAGRYKEYKRLKVLLGFADEDAHELQMLRTQIKTQDQALTTNLRISFGLFILAAVFFGLWLAK